MITFITTFSNKNFNRNFIIYFVIIFILYFSTVSKTDLTFQFATWDSVVPMTCDRVTWTASKYRKSAESVFPDWSRICSCLTLFVYLQFRSLNIPFLNQHKTCSLHLSVSIKALQSMIFLFSVLLCSDCKKLKRWYLSKNYSHLDNLLFRTLLQPFEQMPCFKISCIGRKDWIPRSNFLKKKGQNSNNMEMI